jgi:hypothetical protein
VAVAASTAPRGRRGDGPNASRAGLVAAVASGGHRFPDRRTAGPPDRRTAGPRTGAGGAAGMPAATPPVGVAAERSQPRSGRPHGRCGGVPDRRLRGGPAGLGSGAGPGLRGCGSGGLAGCARPPRAWPGDRARPARTRCRLGLGCRGTVRADSRASGAVPDSTRASRAWPGRTRVTGSDRDPGRAGPSGPAACGSTATLPVAGMPPSRRSRPRRAVNGPSQCVDTPRSPSAIRVNLTAIEGRRCTSRASLSGGHRWLHHRHPRSTCIPS